jgi:hypothetical protein
VSVGVAVGVGVEVVDGVCVRPSASVGVGAEVGTGVGVGVGVGVDVVVSGDGAIVGGIDTSRIIRYDFCSLAWCLVFARVCVSYVQWWLWHSHGPRNTSLNHAQVTYLQARWS